MKHLIETTDPSGLTRVDYNRIILDSNTDDIIVRGGGESNPNGHPYVDLGLPSGLKWATMNVGATSETDYGDYFMWGSTTPNTDTFCDWKNTPFNGGATAADEDSFNSVKDDVCPNGILAKEYDTAAQIMGGDWRMPTQDEFQELIDNTNKEWTTINGVNGYKFTSIKKGYQNNSIFIPAAGDRSGSEFNNRGSEGTVWSSSLSSVFYAWFLRLNSKGCYTDHYFSMRRTGMTVRGVL